VIDALGKIWELCLDAPPQAEAFTISILLYAVSFAFEHMNSTFLQHQRYLRPWKSAYTGLKMDFVIRVVGLLVLTVWPPYIIPEAFGGASGTLFRTWILRRNKLLKQQKRKTQ